jgi:hypothetical protein
MRFKLMTLINPARESEVTQRFEFTEIRKLDGFRIWGPACLEATMFNDAQIWGTKRAEF